MNSKVIRNVLIGIGAYAVFVTVVLMYYKDNPEAMPWDDREVYNRNYIAGLSLDSSIDKSMVIEKLGSPDISEAKKLASGNVHVLFYRTQHVTSDGNTTADECTAMLFEDNQLVAWGENAYQQYKDQQISIGNEKSPE